MEYRILPHGGEKISVLGLGSGSLTGTEQEIEAVITAAIQNGTNYFGEVAERASLYRDCEHMGVGISVMKPFAGGQLLDKQTSLFNRALTHEQCFQYALDRPAVMTVLPGVRNAVSKRD